MEEPRITPQTLLVLCALLETSSEPWYGLALTEWTGLPSGTVYPILARLESTRWAESWWEDIDPSAEKRPRRRMYRLTGGGELAARDAVRKQEARAQKRRTARKARAARLPRSQTA